MNLKPQDIYVMLKLVAIGKVKWAYNKLAVELGMSPSQVHASIKRALKAQLAMQINDDIFANISNLEEFIIHGLKFAFVPELGGITRGKATSYAAAPLSKLIIADGEPIPVWPSVGGVSRGTSLSPLHKSAPLAAEKDANFYALLVLVDAIRSGRARERNLAIKELKKRFAKYA